MNTDKTLRILDTFDFMKDADSFDEFAGKSLTIYSEDASSVILGYLTPLTKLHICDDSIIELLREWRSKNQNAYPSRFYVSFDGTRTWANNAVVNNPNRLLFFVYDRLFRPIGHLGLLLLKDGSLEIDNVLRGEDRELGIMSAALKTLEDWARLELDARNLSLRVLKSNHHAVKFYERLEYSIIKEQAMGWEINGDVSTLIEVDGNGIDYFLTMFKNLEDSEPAATEILTAGPFIGAREVTYCIDAARRGWNSSHSKYLHRFEQEFAEYVGCDYAIATSSCTGAIHLALLAAGIGPGDEVIVPETTWVATASAVTYLGARPVFADVDLLTWTLDPESVRSKITERTRAIIPVHLYGFPAPMSALVDIANEIDAKIIEDAAPAIGALVNEKPVGSIGDAGCFSFQGAKMLVTGEGGMLVTNNREIYERAFKQQDHGRVPGTFWIDEIGRKYKMSNLTAALGLAQLHSSEMQITKKRRISQWYRDCLSNEPYVTFQQEAPNTKSIYWMTSISLSEDAPISAASLAEYLKAEGIDTRPVFPPISSYPIWSQTDNVIGENAKKIGANSLNLPSGVGLSHASVKRVCSTIQRALVKT